MAELPAIEFHFDKRKVVVEIPLRQAMIVGTALARAGNGAEHEDLSPDEQQIALMGAEIVNFAAQMARKEEDV